MLWHKQFLPWLKTLDKNRGGSQDKRAFSASSYEKNGYLLQKLGQSHVQNIEGIGFLMTDIDVVDDGLGSRNIDRHGRHNDSSCCLQILVVMQTLVNACAPPPCHSFAFSSGWAF